MTWLTRRGFELRGQSPKYLPGVTVNRQQRLAPQPCQGAQTLVPDSRIRRDFRSEFQLRDSDRRKVYRLIAGESRNICRSQDSTFNVNPDAGIDQETHGSRTPLDNRSP